MLIRDVWQSVVASLSPSAIRKQFDPAQPNNLWYVLFAHRCVTQIVDHDLVVRSSRCVVCRVECVEMSASTTFKLFASVCRLTSTHTVACWRLSLD